MVFLSSFQLPASSYCKSLAGHWLPLLSHLPTYEPLKFSTLSWSVAEPLQCFLCLPVFLHYPNSDPHPISSRLACYNPSLLHPTALFSSEICLKPRIGSWFLLGCIPNLYYHLTFKTSQDRRFTLFLLGCSFFLVFCRSTPWLHSQESTFPRSWLTYVFACWGTAHTTKIVHLFIFVYFYLRLLQN